MAIIVCFYLAVYMILKCNDTFWTCTKKNYLEGLLLKNLAYYSYSKSKCKVDKIENYAHGFRNTLLMAIPSQLLCCTSAEISYELNLSSQPYQWQI